MDPSRRLRNASVDVLQLVKSRISGVASTLKPHGFENNTGGRERKRDSEARQGRSKSISPRRLRRSKKGILIERLLRLRDKESVVTELKAVRLTGITLRKKRASSRTKHSAFERLEELGEGAYGKVFRAEVKNGYSNLKTGQIVALKEQNASTDAWREARIAKLFSESKYTVQIFDSFTYKGKFLTVMELMDKDIDGFALNESEMLNVSDQIISAINYIHSRGFVHRDLKLENIFMRILVRKRKRHLTIKIGDFGLTLKASEAHGKAAHPLGICPEMLLVEKHVYQGDVFAVGILLLQMVCHSAEKWAQKEDECFLWTRMARLYLLLNTPSKIQQFRICIEEMAREILEYYHSDEETQKFVGTPVKVFEEMYSVIEQKREEVFQTIASSILSSAKSPKSLSKQIMKMLRIDPALRSMPKNLYNDPTATICEKPLDLKTGSPRDNSSNGFPRGRNILKTIKEYERIAARGTVPRNQTKNVPQSPTRPPPPPPRRKPKKLPFEAKQSVIVPDGSTVRGCVIITGQDYLCLISCMIMNCPHYYAIPFLSFES